jgi:valyl-tRNA synthetase
MTLRPNAHDIIRTWDFYTIVRSLYLTGDIPWTDVLIHGHALDPSGKKISKSKLKTAEDPTPMLEQFSADAVRYWTTTVRTGGDTVLNEELFRNGSKLVTKLWNSAKFALQFLQGYQPPSQPPAGLNATDRWLLDRLAEVVRRATAAMDEYEFAAAKAEVERFFWTDLCDNYIELAKSRLYSDAGSGASSGAAPRTNGVPVAGDAGPGTREGAQYALYHALAAVLKLLAPFLPHITEEIYLGGFAETDGERSIHVSRWPQALPEWPAEGAARAGDAILEVAETVRRWKADRQLSVGAPLSAVRVACPADVILDLQGAARDLQSVTRAASVEIVAGANGTVEVTVEREGAPASA